MCSGDRNESRKLDFAGCWLLSCKSAGGSHRSMVSQEKLFLFCDWLVVPRAETVCIHYIEFLKNLCNVLFVGAPSAPQLVFYLHNGSRTLPTPRVVRACRSTRTFNGLNVFSVCCIYCIYINLLQYICVYKYDYIYIYICTGYIFFVYIYIYVRVYVYVHIYNIIYLFKLKNVI